jgi:hypothetical protein
MHWIAKLNSPVAEGNIWVRKMTRMNALTLPERMLK